MAIEQVAARRRLMAVMLADVVDYSRMMSRSEDATHARFASHARELIEPTIDRYGGRLVPRHGRRVAGRVCERGRCGTLRA